MSCSTFIRRFSYAVCILLTCYFSTTAMIKTVTTSSDNVSGSLRSAVSLASAGDTVKFAIPGKDTVILESEIVLLKNITLLGTNAVTGNRIVIQVPQPGVSACRVFTIGGNREQSSESASSTLSIVLRDVVLRGGQPSSGYGGVISMAGNMFADNIVITDGVAKSGNGGGIYTSDGKLTLNNCTISGNLATRSLSETLDEICANGGGIYSYKGRIMISNCAIANNHCLATGKNDSDFISTYANGGGIYTYSGSVTIVNSSIVKNICETHSTAPYPRAVAFGGGLYTYEGQFSLTHCTVIDNACISRHSGEKDMVHAEARGGGILSMQRGTFIVNSIIVHNTITTGNEINTEDIYNFAPGRALNSITDSCASVSFVDCLSRKTIQQIFGSAVPDLANNGGPTQTVLLPANSVAVSAGIKTAIFFRDTSIGIADSIEDIAYLSGTSWLVLKTNEPIPTGKKISPVDYDQRSQIRAAIPCIGAYEYSSTINSVPDIPIACFPIAATLNKTAVPALVWHTAQRATSYHVQVAFSADFTSLVSDTSGIMDTTLVLSGLQLNTRYYWCVSADNSVGSSRWSKTEYFSISSSGVLKHTSVTDAIVSNNSRDALTYTITKKCFVQLTIIDLQGKTVGLFVNQMQGPGQYAFSYSRPLYIPNGLYIQIFSAGGTIKRNTIQILR